MNNKNIQWLHKELPALVDKGIINLQIADRIRDYYGSAKARSRKWVALIVCSILGAILIGAGIILLFGHNWENLSRPIRAILSLLPLLAAQALAGWVIWKRNESVPWKEGTALFLTMMVGASLALVSQTYNLPGDAAGYLLTWMFLILPLVYLMQATVPVIVYIFGITAWSCYTQTDVLNSIMFWLFAAFIVPHFLKIAKDETYASRSTMLGWSIALCLCVAAGVTLGKLWPGFWVVIYSSLFAIMYLTSAIWADEGTLNWQRSFNRIGGLGVLGLSFILSFKWLWHEIGPHYYRYYGDYYGVISVADGIISFGLLAGAVSLFVFCIRRRQSQDLLIGAMPVLSAIGYSLAQNASNILVPVIIFNLYLFVLGVDRISSGIRKKQLIVVNEGMLIVTVLIVARFFDSDMSFLIRGVTFIILGIGFLVANIFLMRFKGEAK